MEGYPGQVYGYVIVGDGTASLVIAARLTENSDVSVVGCRTQLHGCGNLVLCDSVITDPSVTEL